MPKLPLVAALLLLAAAPAFAQDADPSADATANSTPPGEDGPVAPTEGRALTLSGTVYGVSDYRFRGLTQSAEDPALQATLNLEHRNGLYAGVWGSTLKGLGDYGDAELDLYVGYRPDLGAGFSGDLGAVYYYYPDGRGDTDFGEIYGSVGHTIGPFDAKLGIAYAPEGQRGLAGDDSLYLFTDLSAGIPTTPFTLKAHVGYSDGALAAFDDGDYVDYSLGAEAAVGPATVGLSYINTDIRNRLGVKDAAGADGTVVATVSFGF